MHLNTLYRLQKISRLLRFPHMTRDVELIQNSFSDYLQGKVDYDKAKKNFETAIIERYPDITEIQWPE